MLSWFCNGCVLESAGNLANKYSISLIPHSPQTYLFFMWAVIVLLAAALQAFICKKIRGPLDEYKNNELEGKNDGTELKKKESGV